METAIAAVNANDHAVYSPYAVPIQCEIDRSLPCNYNEFITVFQVGDDYS